MSCKRAGRPCQSINCECSDHYRSSTYLTGTKIHQQLRHRRAFCLNEHRVENKAGLVWGLKPRRCRVLVLDTPPEVPLVSVSVGKNDCPENIIGQKPACQDG